MRKFILAMVGFAMVLLIPVVIIWVGIVLGEFNTISIEQRTEIPSNWDTKKIAQMYAPIFYQQTGDKAEHVHLDYFCSFDFDGDLEATNNMENLHSRKAAGMQACVYYCIMESATHFYITYSLFYPLEWSFVDYGMKEWYENTMKHVQVVVEKNSKDEIEGEVILVALSRAKVLEVYKTEHSVVAENLKVPLTSGVLLCNDRGKMESFGTHVAILIESGRHNLKVISQKEESLVLDGDKFRIPTGVVYLPSDLPKGEIPNPTEKSQAIYYSLSGIQETLWHPQHKPDVKELMTGDNFTYRDRLFTITNIPLHFKGRELAGSTYELVNPNVTPFAFGWESDDNQLPKGIFFFNPIDAYCRCLKIKGCSLRYLYHPYATK